MTFIRPARAEGRPSAKKPKVYRAYSFPAPTLGWLSSNNLAMSVPGGAYMLENWFPTPTGAIMRRGKQKYATLGAGNLPVRSLFAYIEGNNRKLFGSTDANIYDITSVSQPNNAVIATEDDDMLATENDDMIGWGSTDGLDVWPNTEGRWIVVQFETAGGTYLRGVNGVDTPFVFDGTDFSTTPAITFPSPITLTPDVLSYVWVYKNRLFFLEKGTTNVWYLPIGQLAGELKKLPMGGELPRGGTLVYGASWSQDVGDGLNEMWVVASSEGEVAVYQGDNPDSASTWSKVGVYRVGKPLGDRAHVQIGGDLAMATDAALVPLTQALRRDYSELAASSFSSPIEAAWPEQVQSRPGERWEAILWTDKQMLVAALPRFENVPDGMLMMNSRTGKWGYFTNWQANCLAVFDGRLFFGSNDGAVYEANVTGADDGVPYTAAYVPMFDQMEAPGHKTMTMARAVLRTAHDIVERIANQTDFTVRLPAVPGASRPAPGSFWGSMIWGQDRWGGAPEKRIVQKWRSQFGTGEVHAPAVMITSGSVTPLDVELIRVDVAFTVADPIT